MEELQFQGRQLTVERFIDRGWDGIVYRDPLTDLFYLCVPRWVNGAYITEVRPFDRRQLDDFTGSDRGGDRL